MNYTVETLCALWLNSADKLTMHARKTLYQKYSSAENIFKAFSSAMRPLLGAEAFETLARGKEQGLLYLPRQLEAIKAYAVRKGEEGYPEALLPLDDAPDILYVKGSLPRCPAISIVGSRHDTRYGRQAAEGIAADLARAGVTVVSGLARGIDTAAHVGALKGGGKTIAVLGSGFLNPYPPENKMLSDNIIKTGGALVSEYPPEALPLAFHFPLRNRIISGLSEGILLIEAQLKSGTMSTVNHALEQGRQVFALPGNIDAPGSALPLKLLKEGALLATCAADILDELKLPHAPPVKKSPAPLHKDPILSALQKEEKTFEELLKETAMTPEALSSALSLLELDGKVEKRAGRAYALVR